MVKAHLFDLRNLTFVFVEFFVCIASDTVSFALVGGFGTLETLPAYNMYQLLFQLASGLY